MKLYLKKTLFFIAPIVLGALIFEILLNQIPNDYEFKKKYLDQNVAEIETLIFGSSHTFAGLRPEYIDGHAFNVAIGGQSLEYDYKIFEKYQDNFKNLKTIIVAVSYPTLWFRLNKHERASALVFNYEKYYDIKYTNRNKNFYLESFNRPLKNNAKMIIHYYIKKKSLRLSDEFGWGKNFKNLDFKRSARIQTKRQYIRDLNSNRNMEVMQESIEILNDMILWGKENDVNVLLLTTPTHHYYHNNLNEEQIEKTASVATELATKHDNCLYLNVLKDDRFQDDDFRDAHHMSFSGAEKLSKLVNQKIKEF